jgi:hypothetical protein
VRRWKDEAETLDLDALGRWHEPVTDVPVWPRSGPIVVTIGYSIDEAGILAFLAAINVRQRIRRRDGATARTTGRCRPISATTGCGSSGITSPPDSITSVTTSAGPSPC